MQAVPVGVSFPTQRLVSGAAVGTPAALAAVVVDVVVACAVEELVSKVWNGAGLARHGYDTKRLKLMLEV